MPSPSAFPLRLRLAALATVALLYGLASFCWFSATQPALYQSSLPLPHPLDAVRRTWGACVPDAPLPDTSLCRTCTLLPHSDSHFHCLACNTTLPTACDSRTEAEYNRSRRDHIVRLAQHKHHWIHNYTRTHGWLLRLVPHSEARGDYPWWNPVGWISDRCLLWALDHEPWDLHPVAILSGLAFLGVLVLGPLLCGYLYWRERVRQDTLAKDATVALLTQAVAVVAPSTTEEEAAAAASAAGGSVFDAPSDLFAVGLRQRQ